MELPARELPDGGVDLAGAREQVRVRDSWVRLKRPLHVLHDGGTITQGRWRGVRCRNRFRLPCGPPLGRYAPDRR